MGKNKKQKSTSEQQPGASQQQSRASQQRPVAQQQQQPGASQQQPGASQQQPRASQQRPAAPQQQPGVTQQASGGNKGPKRQQPPEKQKEQHVESKAVQSKAVAPGWPYVSQQSDPVASAWGPKADSNPVPSAWGSKQESNPVVSAWGSKPESNQPKSQTTASQHQSGSVQQDPGSSRGPKKQQQQEKQKQTQRNQPNPVASGWPYGPQQSESVQSNPIASVGGQKQQPKQTKSSTVENIGLENLTLSDLSRSSSVASSSRSSTSIKSPNIPTSALIPVTPNRGAGKKGRPITIDVNFLPLIIDKLLSTVFQYDVTIEPNLPKRLLPKIFEEYRRKNFKDIFVAFDGQKIAVSPKILPITDKIEKQTKVIDENGKERIYMVAMKEARDSKIDFASLKNYTTMRQYDSPLRAMQMLEIVLKSPFLNKDGVQAGRSFYMLPKKRYDLGDNYELWTGLYQSAILGSRPYLNVDIAHKAFPSQLNIIDILSNMRVNLRNDLDPRAKNDLQSHLKGLMISYAMPGHEASRRTYKFLGFNPNAKTFKFNNDQDKKEYTIADYFRSRGVNIEFLLLPTLKLGNAIKNITVPMEFCSVAGYQAVNKKCTEMQTRNMIKIAATSTDERRQKIMDMLHQIAHNQSPTLQQFGINIGSEFSKAQARILDAPTLEYNGRQVRPSKGQWRIDNLKFLKPTTLSKYAVLIMDKYIGDNQVRDFCSAINRIGFSIGMTIDPNYDIHRLDPFSRNITSEMQNKMSQMITKNIELLFCIIPDRGDTYGKVKQCAELDCGILTQCVKAFTLSRKGTDPSTVSNILLKVNAKLNGTNHKFAASSLPPLMTKPFMLIGADVTHPSPGQDDIPSVVGVVSSHDVHGFQYNKCWRLQDPKQEMIADFDAIIREHLDFFVKKNNKLPLVILYFRDGVSEGQFQEVLKSELNAIYAGCQKYKPDYKPKITFIVVQKRHHTRFFPPKGSDIGRDDRKNNNVPPGTIVDSQITHPNESQFYLVSHQSIQGVAKPTKYCLLRDDSNFSMDELEELTYNLCHFFARCTRSVSYPAPTYYAHLAASRGRVYIEGRKINMSKLDIEFKNRTVKEIISKGHPMHFV